DLLLAPDGKLLLVGDVYSSCRGRGEFGVARFTSGGRRDLAFGAGGLVIAPLGVEEGTPLKLYGPAFDYFTPNTALLEGGKLTAVGVGVPPNSGEHAFAVARFTSIAA